MQPGLEIYVIPDSAANLLGGMDMGIHKSRKDIVTIEFYNFCIGFYQGGIDNTHGKDPVIFNQDISPVIYLVLLIHGEDVALLQEYLTHCFLLSPQSFSNPGRKIKPKAKGTAQFE
jgi:hypothetical protein